MEKYVIRINPAKLAFDYKSLESRLSGRAVIEELKCHTDNNGVVYILNPDTKFRGDFTYIRLEMDYSKSDEKVFALDADNLAKNIYDIFSFCNKEIISSEISLLQEDEVKKILPQHLFETWNTYIRDLDTKGLEECSKHIMYGQGYMEDKNLLAGKAAVWQDYLVSKKEEIVKRLGDGIAPYTVIARAQKVLRLLEVGESKKILNNEINNLIISLAIHRFAKTKTLAKEVV